MDLLLLLEDWADAVRRLKDSTEDRYVTEEVCRDMLARMEKMRFKRPELFIERRGEDYEVFTAELLAAHGIPETMPVLEDDEFFRLCLEVRKARHVQQKTNRLGSMYKQQAWVTRSSASSSASGAPTTS